MCLESTQKASAWRMKHQTPPFFTWKWCDWGPEHTFKITDEALLEKTNGIVQGMSGSPIIQGEYIIGAVTHVVVDNPHKGYGIFITNMLEEGEN